MKVSIESIKFAPLSEYSFQSFRFFALSNMLQPVRRYKWWDLQRRINEITSAICGDPLYFSGTAFDSARNGGFSADGTSSTSLSFLPNDSSTGSSLIDGLTGFSASSRNPSLGLAH
ncbi:hypothetical protein [Alicyclobacillus sp. SO9]|uniref:hypothetical protein n=1 Tax=Alicyclobacillus sp. SO9 TaxID=2665646 RepID=UPI001E3521BD|nr:hypothetical protein [Alicyclobacillus sp. SO9]